MLYIQVYHTGTYAQILAPHIHKDCSLSFRSASHATFLFRHGAQVALAPMAHQQLKLSNTWMECRGVALHQQMGKVIRSGFWTKCSRLEYLGVSINGGTPKSSILIGISLINHPFWGTPF